MDIIKASSTDAGCWIDGHWGQFGSSRLIEIAECYGFTFEPPTDSDCPGDIAEQIYEIADEAENWLNAHVAPEGFYFGWYEGEFFLWSAETWDEGY